MTAMHCVEDNEAIADEITVNNVPDFLTPTIVLSGKIITFLSAEDAYFCLRKYVVNGCCKETVKTFEVYIDEALNL